MALGLRNMSEEAIRILKKLNPILQSRNDPVKYRAEPYVLPGNIDGTDSGYPGRAGWTWYTGSSSWLFTIAHEVICGIQPTAAGLRISLCIPKEWECLRIRRLFRGAVYQISVKRTKAHRPGPVISVNGSPIDGDVVPVLQPGTHRIDVLIGS
jgi:cellobiose phosphorylase